MKFREKPHRSRRYLDWVRTQHGACCVCRTNRFEERHHFGKKGMGQKCSDLLVCRVCKGCHSRLQGKRRIAFERLGQLDVWADMLEDAMWLLERYTALIEQSHKVEIDDPF